MSESANYSEPAIATGYILHERYELLEEIGQGAMGIVFRAQDLLLERPVAVKLLSKTDPSGDQRQRLLVEAKAAAKLNHPNVVAVHDAGDVGGIPYIVMEYVDGQTLRNHHDMPEEEAISVGQDMCMALEHAHSNGVIHRDLKPENVMVTSSGLAKLMDFGLARVSGRSRQTMEGTLIGTIAYLAPELIAGQPASERSDLYALGVILYEMTAGRQPFEGDNMAVLLSNHLHAPVIPPRVHDASISASLDDLIIELLEKDPSRRPGSAAEVLQRLTTMKDPSHHGASDYDESPSASILDRIASGRLVGRDAELAQATSLWTRARSGQAGLLLISGEPGIGKTRLAQALIAQARLGAAAVFSGGCYEFEATTPYLPFSEAIRAWLHDHDVDQIREALGDTANELFRLVPEIETRLGPLPPNPELGPEEQRLRLFENIAQFLESIAHKSGLLLLIDDLHWADRGTLSLLSYLMRRLQRARLLVVAAYREVELDRKHSLADALVQWNRQRVAVRIQLSRLSPRETEALLASLFRETSISDDFVSVIHQETDGNPFFIEEVIKSLVERGQVYWADGRWHRDELEHLAIPQSIKEAVGRRLNALSDPCVDVLHAAAVIGKDFPFFLLFALLAKAGFDEDLLIEALEEARSTQLIRQLGDESFVFTHDKIREVLYDEIIGVRRRRLHLQTALVLEERAKGIDAARLEDLAYHFVAGGNLEKGMEYALLAAAKAQKLFAGHEAIEYFTVAHECAVSLNDGPKQAAILESLGDIYSTVGPYDEAIKHYRQAAELSVDRRLKLDVKIGLVLNTINDEAGIPILENVLKELAPDEDPLTFAGALTALGRFYHYRSEYGEAIRLYQQARELVEPLGEPVNLALIYGYLAGAYQHLVQMEQSHEWAEAAIRLGMENNLAEAVATGHEFVAENHVILGFWEEAREAAALDYRVGKEVGSAPRMAWATYSAGFALYGLGALGDALETLEQALEQALTIGENRLAVLTTSSLSLVYADLGDERALDYALRAAAGSSEMVEPVQSSNAQFVAGYAHLRLADLEVALSAFEACEQILAGSEIRDITLFRLPYHAECLAMLDRLDEAEVQLSAGLTLSKEAGSLHYEAVCHRVSGMLHARGSNYSAALKAFERAHALAGKVGSRIEIGRIAFWRARTHLEQSQFALAVQDAQEARSVFVACGARQHLLQVDDLIMSLP